MPIWTEAFHRALLFQGRKVELPSTAEGVGDLLGVERTYRTVTQVHQMQAALADVIIQAAEERWPELGKEPLMGDDFERKCWENALSRWPGIETLAAALVNAERAMYLDKDMPPTA